MNQGSAESERLREAFASLACEARPSGDCPPAEMIWAAVRGELPAARRREIGLHLVSCPACVEACRLAREVAGEAGAVHGVSRSPSWWLGWSALAAAAAVILMVVVVFTPFRHPSGGTVAPTFRAPDEEPIRSLLPADEQLSRGSFILRWTGLEGARYTVRVATEELTVIDRAFDLDAAEYQVPEERLTALRPGARIVWRVEAVLPDSTKIRSRSFVTEVK